MNENINLCEILADTPRGTRFHSPLLGTVTYAGMDKSGNTNICVECGHKRFWFRKDGKISFPYGSDTHSAECMLVPSETQRDWSKYKNPKNTVAKFDIRSLDKFESVLVRSSSQNTWDIDVFSHIDKDGNVICLGGKREYVIPCNKETEYLRETAGNCKEYYRWWE